jgi:tetratricopeptide (TPR) repeat protein
MSLYPDEFAAPQEEPHIRQARELLEQKQPQEAIQVIRRHLSFAPATSTDYEFLAVALAQSGERQPAIEAMEQASKMDSHDAAIAYNLGLLYRQAGREQDAVTAFERAVGLRPDYAAAREALEQLQQQGLAVSPGRTAAPAGPVKCPHCGMESRSVVDCEWCAHPLREPARPAAPAAPVGAQAVHVSLFDRLFRGGGRRSRPNA